MPDLNAALERARAARETQLEDYCDLLRIPSVSTLPAHAADIRHCADWLAERLRAGGMEKVGIMPTPGHPIVYAESEFEEDRPTVLVYGHYDVQPVDPVAEWRNDPFEPTVEDDYLIARGASDMKGQLFAFLCALEAFGEDDAPEVNLKVLFEGEEEIGSAHLEEFIADNKELLACDFVLNCDAGIHEKDTPAINYALRGLAYFELELRTAQRDLHSGLYGGSVRNPLHELCNLIAGMHDAQGRVTLPGFYDVVRALSEEERALIAQLPHDDAEWLAFAGASETYGEAGFTTLERVGARPTLEINGLWGGFTGEGSKTVLPAKANAKISCRLVPDQDETAIQGMLEAYLKAHVPAGVEWSLRDLACGPGAVMDRTAPHMKAAAAALEAVFGKAPLFKREGGSVPVVGLMKRMLGVETVMLGFALPDDGIHGPNERQYLPNFYRGIETYIHFLAGLG